MSAFHDCVTVCDGCINITDSSNAGLFGVIEELEGLYDDTYSVSYSGLSRADFWAIASIAAIDNGVDMSNKKCDT